MQYCTSSDSEAIRLGNNRCMHTSMDDTHLASHTPIVACETSIFVHARYDGHCANFGSGFRVSVIQRQFCIKHIGIHSLVRSLESRSVRFSEVM